VLMSIILKEICEPQCVWISSVMNKNIFKISKVEGDIYI